MTGLIVHEWIEATGGAEKVVEEMLSAFPDASLTCLWSDAPRRFGERHVSESWMSRSPLRRSKAFALPFMLAAWRALDIEPTPEWMLVSSHLFAHHARLRSADVPKYVYAHTPARYIWNPELDRRGASLHIRAASAAIRPIDRRRAGEAVRIAANSDFVRQRIERAWDREAVVIHPPVDVDRITAVAEWSDRLSSKELMVLDGLPDGFLLGASRFVPYKRLDLVIRAGVRSGRPVVIAGRGPEEQALREVAASSSVPVHFVISPSDELLFALYQRAATMVFPAVEDFGIMPVEAQAAGCPVVVADVGGAGESIRDGVSGIIGPVDDEQLLGQMVERSITLRGFDATIGTARFAPSRFRREITEFVG